MLHFFFFLYVRQPLISCMSKTTPPLLNYLNSSLIRLFLLWEASRFLSPIYSYPPCGRACYCTPLTLLPSVTMTFTLHFWGRREVSESPGHLPVPHPNDNAAPWGGSPLLAPTIPRLQHWGSSLLHPQAALCFPGKAMWSQKKMQRITFCQTFYS